MRVALTRFEAACYGWCDCAADARRPRFTKRRRHAGETDREGSMERVHEISAVAKSDGRSGISSELLLYQNTGTPNCSANTPSSVATVSSRVSA